MDSYYKFSLQIPRYIIAISTEWLSGKYFMFVDVTYQVPEADQNNVIEVLQSYQSHTFIFQCD